MNESIFGIGSQEMFLRRCLETFQYQYNYNPVYRRYVDLLGVDRYEVRCLEGIPFMPIRFFKSQRIISSGDEAVEAEKVFTSSATTGMVPSKHYVTDLSLYEESFLRGFAEFYGPVRDYAVLALLPSYLEREGSSLVYMADRLIRESGHPESGFFLYNFQELQQRLIALRAKGQKTLLLGVTFALLDFAEKCPLAQFEGNIAVGNTDAGKAWPLIVMETGGMKGRGEELERGEVHRRLKEAFGVDSIHSEYGMCELLSQAYSSGGGIFRTPAWMKVVVRDFADGSKVIAAGNGVKGAINVIDLANVNSCSFIETDDAGTLYGDGSFSVDGRVKKAERRGCNMLLD